MGNTAADDIIDAVYRLRIAFKKHGMEPPVAIELGAPKDGSIFRHLMTREMIHSDPRMGVDKDNPAWVANVMGIEVVMPAEWRSERGGKILHDPQLYNPPRPKDP